MVKKAEVPQVSSSPKYSRRRVIRELDKLVQFWGDIFQLNHYSIYWELVPELKYDRDDEFCDAATEIDPGTQQAWMYFNEKFWKTPKVNDHNASILVAHEMHHILVAEHIRAPMTEMLNLMKANDLVKGTYLQRIEETIERLTRHHEYLFEKVEV